MRVASGSPDLGTIGLILEALPDAAVVVDRSSRILAANQRFERDLRRGREGDDLTALVDDRGRVNDVTGLWFGSTSPRPAMLTVAGQHYRCDGARLGRHRLALVRCVTRAESAEAFTATSRAVDLERLERTKARLREALRDVQASNTALRSSNEELERFASIVSHDLQSPLLVIRGMASTLLEQLDDAARREFAQAVVDNAEKMQRQIRGILEVARAGASGPAAEPLPLHQAVDAVRELLTTELAPAPGSLVVEGELPAVPLTRTEAVQLLQNLIQNGLKFAGGADPARVVVSALRRDGVVEVTVEDNGPGVPEAERQAVFDLFHRLGEDREGTGIGLATCRRIVERHGGRIWIDDSRLGGAAVRFTLPSARGDEQAL